MSQELPQQPQTEPEVQPQVQPQPQESTAEQHLTYGIVAIIVGLFCVGAVAGWVACYHGSQFAEKAGKAGRQDLQTAGTVVQWIGVVEAVVMGLYLLSLLAR